MHNIKKICATVFLRCKEAKLLIVVMISVIRALPALEQSLPEECFTLSTCNNRQQIKVTFHYCNEPLDCNQAEHSVKYVKNEICIKVTKYLKLFSKLNRVSHFTVFALFIYVIIHILMFISLSWLFTSVEYFETNIKLIYHVSYYYNYQATIVSSSQSQKKIDPPPKASCNKQQIL